MYGESDFGVETKDDDSPLTRADLAAHQIIVRELGAAFPDTPVLSEESDGITFEERRQWARYFLVDPLDGTKEFINRNGEFTVNIAYVQDGIPVRGVVYVPVKDVLYVGDGLNDEAWIERDNTREDIRSRPVNRDQPLTVVASRRHGGETLERCLEVVRTEFSDIETTNMGSSLKLCLVAEGSADIYPRLAPTSEWDTAAAHCVLIAAGGKMIDLSGHSLCYNKPDILNPWFLACGDPEENWLAFSN